MPAPVAAAGDGVAEPVRVSSRPTRAPAVAAGSAAETISRRLSALLGASAAARSPATTAAAPARPAATPGNPSVRVSSQQDPAAFIVQTGAYRDPDYALELEHELTEAGFTAVARSYRVADGSIVHRVAVGGNMTRTKADQLLARLTDLGYTGILAQRDDVAYLPPPPPSR
jgi:cell division septation protein DedD